MYRLKINKNDFVQHVLTPLSRVADNTVLNLNNEGLYSVCASQVGGSVVLYVNVKDTEIFNNKEPLLLGLPDIKRFVRLLDCIDCQTLELDIIDNHIVYKDDSFKFKYFLIEESVLPKNTLNVDKIKKLTFDHEFVLTNSKFNDIIKASSITVDSDKLYIYTQNGSVYCELNDYERQNINCITYKITSEFTGTEIKTPIVLGLESVRLFSGTKADSFNIKINTALKIVSFEYFHELVTLKYIVSSLVK